MAVQVNDTVNVLCKLPHCYCPSSSSSCHLQLTMLAQSGMTIFIGVYLYYLFTVTLDQVSLTSSISGRNACPSEEVTFTCTAQGITLFWGHKGFGEITMHYMSPPSRGDFRAEIVSYDRNQSCLVSSLRFRATASRNGTVTCTNTDRSSSRLLSLHIMSSECLVAAKLQVLINVLPCTASILLLIFV